MQAIDDFFCIMRYQLNRLPQIPPLVVVIQQFSIQRPIRCYIAFGYIQTCDPLICSEIQIGLSAII